MDRSLSAATLANYDPNRPWYISYERYNINPDIQLPSAHSSLLDMLETSFRQYADKTAYISGTQQLSYAALDKASLHIATHLQALGLQKGDAVGVMLPNMLQYPVVTAAVIRAGLVLVSFNPSYTPRELSEQLVDSGVKVLFMLDKFSRNFAELNQAVFEQLELVVMCRLGDMYNKLLGVLIDSVTRSKLPKNLRKQRLDQSPLTSTVQASQATPTSSAGKTKTAVPTVAFYYLSDWLRPHPTYQYQRPALCLNDVVLVQYTGGTTGSAKGAVLSHGNIYANLLQIDNLLKSAYDEDGQTDIVLAALPMYHVFSFTICCILLLYRGFTGLLIANPRNMRQMIQQMREYPPSFILGVTPLFSGLLQQPEFRQLDFSRLKATIGGGMSILPSIAKRWHELTGLPIVEGYGLSETAPVVAFNPLTIAEFTNKVGIPAPMTDIVLLDKNYQSVPIGERGEIAIKGPQVMHGYQNMPEETEQVFTDNGYFLTGDIGIMDERGFIKIVDRKKDLMVVSGFNVYPAEIESVMLKHPNVLECVAIGIPSPTRGEEPKIFVVAKTPELTEKELIAFGKAHLTGYKRPRHVAFVDSLPKSSLGKVLRKELRKREGLE